MKRVIAVTGTPATGKTRVSRKLSRELDSELVDLTGLINSEGLSQRFDKKRDSIIVDRDKLNDRVNEMVGKSPKQYIILDGLVSHMLDVTHVLVLRCDPIILKDRLESRGYSREKVFENLEAEYEGVCLYDCIDMENVYELDCTGSIQLKPVLEWLKTGGKNMCEIDWTSQFKKILSKG